MIDRHEWQRDAAVWLAGRRIEAGPATDPIAARSRLARAMPAFHGWQAAAQREADAARFAGAGAEPARGLGRGVRRIDRPPEAVGLRPSGPLAPHGARRRGGSTRRRWPSWAWRPARGASCSTSRARPGSRCRPISRPAATWPCGSSGDSMVPLLHSGDVVLRGPRRRRRGRRGGRGPASGARLRREAGGTGAGVGAFAGIAQPGLPERWCSRRAPGQLLGPVVLRWCDHAPGETETCHLSVVRASSAPGRRALVTSSECPWHVAFWLVGGSRS